jgi:hypothetical protein
MEESEAVRDGLLAFYERFSGGDPAAFAAGIADVPGVSVIGTAPGEGHAGRADWISTYETMITGEMRGTRIEGSDPRGFSEGRLGFATDDVAFVLPDGRRLPARLTGVLREGEDGWQVVHLHFSVGVPDEDAVVAAGQ